MRINYNNPSNEEKQFKKGLDKFVSINVENKICMLVNTIIGQVREDLLTVDFDYELMYYRRANEENCINEGFEFLENDGEWYYSNEDDPDFDELTAYSCKDVAVENCIRNEDISGSEVDSYFIISKYLGDMLIEQGETVIDDFFGLCVWCRTGYGGIADDEVIQVIYNNLLDRLDGTRE